MILYIPLIYTLLKYRKSYVKLFKTFKVLIIFYLLNNYLFDKYLIVRNVSITYKPLINTVITAIPIIICIVLRVWFEYDTKIIDVSYNCIVCHVIVLFYTNKSFNITNLYILCITVLICIIYELLSCNSKNNLYIITLCALEIYIGYVCIYEVDKLNIYNNLMLIHVLLLYNIGYKLSKVRFTHGKDVFSQIN